MQACEGSITVETQPERGTTVHLFFPAVDKAAPAGAAVGRGQRVLFLDDEPVLAALGEVRIEGVETNLLFLQRTLDHASFRAGEVFTGFIDAHKAVLLAK